MSDQTQTQKCSLCQEYISADMTSQHVDNETHLVYKRKGSGNHGLIVFRPNQIVVCSVCGEQEELYYSKDVSAWFCRTHLILHMNTGKGVMSKQPIHNNGSVVSTTQQ